MAALINALDNFTPTQRGENGHAEYGWSNNIQEKILQFSFQVTRTHSGGIESLSTRLADMLRVLKHRLDFLPERELAKEYLSVLFKMIGHTRDIVHGKGEYALSYMMVHTWYAFFPKLALFALKCFVLLPPATDGTSHPYGSWKDLNYFCEYCRKKGATLDSELIRYCVQLINEQLKRDYATYLSNSNDVSLAAKWAPREKSAFGWLYESLATHYFAGFLETAKTAQQRQKAILKCKTEYRKLLSALNRHIDTHHIKQCERNWSAIDFNKVTSISLMKHKKAFLNVKKNGKPRFPDNEDRNQCATNFKKHIERAVKGETEVKGKRIGMADFVKQATDLMHRGRDSQAEKDLLNSQWRDNATQTGALGKMIAMVDVSGSMSGDPMHVAIALGIRIAEKSILGNRVMTFSSSPEWVNLEGLPNFIDKVERVVLAPWGMNTNFHAALTMILDAIVQNKMSHEDVQDMVLVILSDMQMDEGDNCDKQTLYHAMEKKYAEAGIRVHGVPYKPPHILFWNLRSTSGFPSLSSQRNASMMSGFSPALLNVFCDEGLESLPSCTPWSLLKKSLDNERYGVLAQELEAALE